MSRSWHLLLMDDHQAAEKAMTAMEQALAAPAPPNSAIVAGAIEFFSVYVDQCHNKKEELHLFPLVERLGVPRDGGPLAVMLAEHDQSRELLARWKPLAEAFVAGDSSVLDELRRSFVEYAALLKNHFWKESDILYPMALRVMSPADGDAVIAGIGKVEASLGADTHDRFYAMADDLASAGNVKDLSFDLDRDILAAILNTLPVEISFVDSNDIVRYFSHESSDKIFPHGRSSIGTPVQECHPDKSIDKVNQILQEFKAGRRDVAEFWIDFSGLRVHIRYFPVRDPKGTYLGCLEVVQDITAIQKLRGERRLLDL